MSRKTIYFPHSLLFFVVLVVLLGAAVALIFFATSFVVATAVEEPRVSRRYDGSLQWRANPSRFEGVPEQYHR